MHHQLKQQIMRNSSEQVHLLNEGVKQIVRNAGSDGFGKRIQNLLLLKPF